MFSLSLFIPLANQGNQNISLYSNKCVEFFYLTFWFLLAPFFVECVSEQDLDEMNIEIIRNTLYKVRDTSVFKSIFAVLLIYLSFLFLCLIQTFIFI